MGGGGGGSAPHGSQYYVLSDTGSFTYVTLDTVALRGPDYTTTVSCWLHVEATSWERLDKIEIWIEDSDSGDGAELMLLVH
jgi:hypothetical protein